MNIINLFFLSLKNIPN